MGSITDWISAISAALALVFAIWARYMAEGSKKARAEAEEAKRQAKDHLDAIVRQTAFLQQIAQTLAAPELDAEWVNSGTLLVRNNGKQVVELISVESEQVLDFEPATLEPGRSVKIHLFTAMGMPMPGELVFATAAGTAIVRLDLASRPR